MSSTLALRFSGTDDPLRISAIGRVSGAMTLEVWIRPDAPDQERAVLVCGHAGWHLALTAGGGRGDIALVMEFQGKKMVVCQAQGVLSKGRWSHIAATVAPVQGSLHNLPGTTVTLFHQGQQAATTSVPLASQSYVFLNALTSATLLPDCYLGRGFGKVLPFSGDMSEARLWSSAVPAATVASRRLTRLRGDEGGLMACYRLDQNEGRVTHDISRGRGFGVTSDGHTLVDGGDLPLPASTGQDQIYLVTKAKLLRETLPIPVKVPDGGPVFITRPGTGGLGGGLGGTGLGGRQPGTGGGGLPTVQKTVWTQRAVFDATLTPRSPNGASLIGRQIEVRLDDAMRAIVDDNDTAKLVDWAANQSYFVPVPAAGRVRLRFVASALSCPTLRVRVEGMPAGLWIIVRPDLLAHHKLRSVTQADLAQPADGRPSPVDGASPDDTAALSQALQSIGRALPPAAAPRSAAATLRPLISARFSVGGVLHDIGDGAKDVYDGAKDVYDDAKDLGESTAGTVGDATGGAIKVVVATSQDAVKGAQRVAKSAGALYAKSGAQLDTLLSQAKQAPAQYGQGAIATFVDSADSLAVWAEGAADTVARTFEIVGTTLVNGAIVAWRVVCAGVNDAIAAVAALCKRIGAEIEAIIDYLAYLFNWQDFLAASDQAYAYFDQVLGELPDRLRQAVAGMKPKIGAALNTALDGGFAQKSIAQMCGIDITDDTPGIDEINYVFEIVQRALTSAQLVIEQGVSGAAHALGGAAGGAGLDDALGQTASGVTAMMPFDKIGNPAALLTTPLADLVKNATAMSSSSGSVLDWAFSAMDSGLSDAMEQGAAILRKRLYVPTLTGMVEDWVLGGRTLNLLRIAALYAGIMKVLTDKIAKKAAGGSARTARSNAIVQPRSDTQTQPDPQGGGSSGQPRQPWEIWGPASAGFVNTLCLVAQTAVELATMGKPRSERVRWWLGLFSYGCAISTCFSSVFHLVSAGHMPPRTKDYIIALSAFEAVAGAWVATTCLIRRLADAGDEDAKAREKREELLDKIDTAGLTVISLGTLITSAIPMIKQLPQGSNEWATYSLRAATSVMTSATRAWSMFDNQGAALRKQITIALLLLSFGVEGAEGVYDYTQDLQST